MGSPAEEGTKTGSGVSIARIEIINAVLLFALAAVFYFAGPPGRALAVIAGGLLTAASLGTASAVMGRIIAPGRKGFWPVAVFWLKYMAMIAAVGVFVLKFKIDIPGFLIGVSLIAPSIVIEAVLSRAARED